MYAVDRRTSLCIFRKVGRERVVSRVESSGRERVRSVTRVKGCIVVTSRGRRRKKGKKEKGEEEHRKDEKRKKGGGVKGLKRGDLTNDGWKNAR